MINTILIVVIMIFLFFISYKIGNNKQECPDVKLSCPDVSCPKHECPNIECPNIECPNIECPKLECPKYELQEQKCPDIKCPDVKCPTLKCPSETHFLTRIHELEDELKIHKNKKCPTEPPCIATEKVIFEPKIVNYDELVFIVKSSGKKQKMKITYNGGNIIKNNIKLDTSYENYTFKIKDHSFVETIEISVFGDGEVDFHDSKILFKNKNILKNEIRYYDHDGNLIFNAHPGSKEECHQGKLKHSGYLKIFVNPEDDLDKFFIH